MRPYRTVQTGPKTFGGGLYGGCRNAIYVFCVSLGEMEKPTAVPAAIGSRMEAAGCSNKIDGNVREGM